MSTSISTGLSHVAARRTIAVVLLGLLLGCALMVHSASAATGITSFSAEPTTTQAGGHPDLTVGITWLDRTVDPKDPCLCDNPRVFSFHAPTGFIGDPHNLPTCTLTQFNLDDCPEASQVGTATIGDVFLVPIYNMETHPDQAGLIALLVPLAHSPAFIDLSGRTESDYGLDSNSSPIIQLLPFGELHFTLWGVPADPSHTSRRFHTPLIGLGECDPPGGFLGNDPCDEEVITGAPPSVPPAPYLQNPTTCGLPLSAGADLSYYNGDSYHADYAWPATTGCQQLSFNPSLTAVPTTSAADSASGLDVDLKVPQAQSPYTPSASEIRTNTVTLPPGFSINPNAADGKLACADADTAIGTRGGATCPEFSKVGTVSLDVAALPGRITGALYLGEPKPGERYRLILTADGFGTHVKLVGSVRPDPATGQLVTTFQLPQSNLQETDLHFFGSERGLLATPTQCGTYPVQSEFVPWDDALPTQHSTSFFTIDSGPNGTPCPGSVRPFDPKLQTGVANNTAGAHSSFALRLTREDGDQFLTGLTVATPPGFAATLRGIPYCPESAISQLATFGYSGFTEQMTPSCPVASQIGTATAGVGAGNHPLYTPGKVYLAGPYKGAPLSLEVVIPAVSGPYDLGAVAVRAAINVDRTTARVTTVSDPLPQILEGIPLRTRSILVDLDRQDFALNPTNCGSFSVDTSVSGDQGGVAAPQAHFQVANCADLPYSPKLSLKLSGGVNRLGHPAIHSVFTAGAGEANSRTISVALPPDEQLDNAHVGNICTRVDFAKHNCPADSVIGSAEASTPLLDAPLDGSVYLRSNPEHNLPDLVVDLKGQLDIELAGRIDSAKGGGLRTTFETVPDAPVSQFVLNLAGGSKGLLINSESLCGAPKKATVRMTGQNGKALNTRVKLQATCGSKARHKRHRRPGAGR